MQSLWLFLAADKLKNDLAAVRPAPVLDQINSLPCAQRQSAAGDRHMQRHAIEHRLHMGRHVVGPFDIMNPGRIFRRKPIERSDEIGLHIRVGVFPEL